MSVQRRMRRPSPATGLPVCDPSRGVTPLPVGTGYRPSGSRENSPRRLVPHTWVLTARILRRWSRDPATVVQSLVMPAGFLVALNIVLGEGVEQVTGHSGLYGSVPLVALVGAMTGAIIGGISIMREREVGLLSRLWVLPVHRASACWRDWRPMPSASW